MPASRPLVVRLMEKVQVDGDCWRFTGAISVTGYGRIGYRRHTLQAHRASYEIHRGPIPDGLHIDHLCGNRWCVNPEHLEAVTQRENNIRAAVIRRAQHRACKYGHEMTEQNTMTNKRGRRQCRPCHNERARVRRALLRGGIR